MRDLVDLTNCEKSPKSSTWSVTSRYFVTSRRSLHPQDCQDWAEGQAAPTWFNKRGQCQWRVCRGNTR